MKATIMSIFSRDDKLWHEAVTENSLRLNFACPEGGPLKIGDVIRVSVDLLDQEQLASVYTCSKSVLITLDGRYVKDLALLEKADPAPVSPERLKGGPAAFDHNTLLLQARQYVAYLSGGEVRREGFEVASVQDAVAFSFVKEGEGRFLIVMNKQTGDLISKAWFPQTPPAGTD